MPPSTQTVGFADDIDFVVIRKQYADVTTDANEVVAIIRRWLTSMTTKI